VSEDRAERDERSDMACRSQNSQFTIYSTTSSIEQENVSQGSFRLRKINANPTADKFGDWDHDTRAKKKIETMETIMLSEMRAAQGEFGCLSYMARGEGEDADHDEREAEREEFVEPWTE
jgi:hypothetical protein